MRSSRARSPHEQRRHLVSAFSSRSISAKKLRRPPVMPNARDATSEGIRPTYETIQKRSAPEKTQLEIPAASRKRPRLSFAADGYLMAF